MQLLTFSYCSDTINNSNEGATKTMNANSRKSRISIYSLHTKCSTVEELLTQVGQYLIDNDVVQGDFVSALQTRERSFPTGLELDGAAIAIPHVEATYCRRTALLVATNNYPLPFNRMDNPSAVLSYVR